MQQPTIGEKIYQLRSQKGITQKELADLCTIDIRTIQRIESGEVIPRMHTIRLLATALGVDHSTIFNTASQRNTEFPVQGIKVSMIAGIIFSTNAFLVVYYLIHPDLPTSILTPCITIHAVSGVLFFRGFYLLGKNAKNRMLEIPSLISMVLFPLTNLTLVVRIFFPALVDSTSMSFASNIFTMLCVNDIFSGIGLMMQASNASLSVKAGLYRIAGFLVLVPTLLYLGSTAIAVAAGLIISLGGNIVLTYLLFAELKTPNRRIMENIPAIS